MRRSTLLPLLLSMTAMVGIAQAEPPGYKLEKTIPIPRDGGWDYLTVDPEGRRVYISHSTSVEVLDADSGESKGQVANTPGIHGIAVASEFGRGFTSNGRSSAVSVFDLKTLKTLETVSVGKGPDAILYDPGTKRVFTFNGGGENTTAIDAATSKVAGTLDLGGKPESAVADGKGIVYVNLEDKGEVVKFDADKLKVLERWSVAPAKDPVSLAIDTKTGRLFVGCRSKSLVILSTSTGKAVATLPIGERVDAGAFDPVTKLAFCSCGDGTVRIVAQESDDKYSVVETLKTRTGSKTMALDTKTHRLFLPAVEYKAGSGKGRPSPVAGSFVVLMFGK